jgi:hypothetical protein
LLLLAGEALAGMYKRSLRGKVKNHLFFAFSCRFLDARCVNNVHIGTVLRVYCIKQIARITVTIICSSLTIVATVFPIFEIQCLPFVCKNQTSFFCQFFQMVLKDWFFCKKGISREKISKIFFFFFLDCFIRLS